MVTAKPSPPPGRGKAAAVWRAGAGAGRAEAFAQLSLSCARGPAASAPHASSGRVPSQLFRRRRQMDPPASVPLRTPPPAAPGAPSLSRDSVRAEGRPPKCRQYVRSRCSVKCANSSHFLILPHPSSLKGRGSGRRGKGGEIKMTGPGDSEGRRASANWSQSLWGSCIPHDPATWPGGFQALQEAIRRPALLSALWVKGPSRQGSKTSQFQLINIRTDLFPGPWAWELGFEGHKPKMPAPWESLNLCH